MKIFCETMAHPKRLSKILASTANVRLNRAQTAVALMFGYADWHELETTTAQAHRRRASLPDRMCSPDVVASRRIRQWQVLTSFLGVPPARAAEILTEIKPTDAFRTREEREWILLVDSIFPPSWSFAPEPSLAREYAKVFEARKGTLTASVTAPSRPAESDILVDCSTIPPGGARVLCLHGADGSESPWMAVVLSLAPLVDQDVLVGVDVTLAHVSTSPGGHLDGAFEIAAIATGWYLNQPALGAFSVAPVTGAFDGVQFRLHGDLETLEARAFADALSAEFEEAAATFAEYGQMEEDDLTNLQSDARVFPVRSFEDCTVRPADGLLDELLGDEWAVHIAAALPQHVAIYLRKRQDEALASAAEAFATHAPLDTSSFLAFLNSTAASGALPGPVMVFLKMLAIGEFDLRAPRTRDNTDSRESARDHEARRPVNVANDLGDPDFADFLADTGSVELCEVVVAGRTQFMETTMEIEEARAGH